MINPNPRILYSLLLLRFERGSSSTIVVPVRSLYKYLVCKSKLRKNMDTFVYVLYFKRFRKLTRSLALKGSMMVIVHAGQFFTSEQTEIYNICSWSVGSMMKSLIPYLFYNKFLGIKKNWDLCLVRCSHRVIKRDQWCLLFRLLTFQSLDYDKREAEILLAFGLSKRN